jgi:hypothetical protein
MQSEEKSLRWLIEKWLPSTPDASLRLTRYAGSKSRRRRIVRVQTSGAGMPFDIFFFRHDDGAWRIFPPAPGALAMNHT